MTDIVVVIVDELPKCANECHWCDGYYEQASDAGSLAYQVDCNLLNTRTLHVPFRADLERCPYCPLTTEEEYRKAER